MLTPHEAAVARLKLLDRAEHPEIEEVLAVARMYPVDVQAACADAMKRGGDPATVEPIKAVADRQAVELQELLDALTAPATPFFAPGSIGAILDAEISASAEEKRLAAEPVVIASEPFKITDLPEAHMLAALHADSVRFENDPPLAPIAEEAHEPLIPAELDTDHPAQ